MRVLLWLKSEISWWFIHLLSDKEVSGRCLARLKSLRFSVYWLISLAAFMRLNWMRLNFCLHLRKRDRLCVWTGFVCYSQWWPVLIAVLSREDSRHRSVVCGSGVRRFSGQFGAGCDRHGSLHSAARIRSGHGQPCRRLHGDTRGQIPQEVCSYQGWCMCAVKHYWNLKWCFIYRSCGYEMLFRSIMIMASLHSLCWR